MEQVAQPTTVQALDPSRLTSSPLSPTEPEIAIEAGPQRIEENKQNENVENETEEDKEIRKEVERAIEARKTSIRKECMGAKKRLDLGFSNIDDLDAYTIAMCLSDKEPVLELLHLGANKLSGEGLRVILTGLQWHIKLKELYLGNNKLDDDGIEDFIEILPVFQDLQILSLGNIGINDSLGVFLASSLASLPNLKSVMLNSNNLSDMTFVKFSTMFNENSLSCSTIHLGENKPTAIGMIALLQSLENNKTLKNLHINDMLLTDEAAGALNKMLVRNMTLEQLNLGNCGIEDEVISMIKFGLMCNKSLKSLYLWGNRITNEGAFFLKTIVEEHNFNLTDLVLSTNLINEESLLEEIKLVLKRNEKLESIQNNTKKAFQVWASIMSQDEKQENVEGKYEDKQTIVEKLEKEIKDAEKKLEEAKKEVLAMKDIFQGGNN